MNIFMIAGEASGDSLGGALISSLIKQNPNIEIRGIGGPLMKEQGLHSLIPMQQLCVMGIAEIFMQIPRLLKLINAVVEEIENRQPDIVVTIDLPDFNFRVAQKLKKRGIFKGKVIHYVAPTVWAWRPGRAKHIAAFLDGLLCLFPFEPDYFKVHSLKAEYVGHPMIEHDPNHFSGQQFRQSLGIDNKTKLLGLFFGSRHGELEKTGAVIAETAIKLKEHIPDVHFIVPTLQTIEFEIVNIMKDIQAPHHILTDQTKKWDIFSACDAALAVSGTVALELAYANVPHLIGYKTNIMTWMLLKCLVRTHYAHLGNIILNQNIIPEFLQFSCTSEKLSDAALGLLTDEQIVNQQRRAFSDIRTQMSFPSSSMPSDNAAKFILSG